VLLRALHALNQNILTSNLFDPDLIRGSLSDWNSLGDHVFELREHFGAGYRVYYGIEKQTVILLLCGGDKSSQTKDIKLAKQYWQDFKKGS